MTNRWFYASRVTCHITKHAGRETYQEQGSEGFAGGNQSKINPHWRLRIKQILTTLKVATHPTDLSIPGFAFHELKGDRKGTYAIKVTGNWRVTFKWDEAGPSTWSWRTIMAGKPEEITMEPSHPGEIIRETILPALGMSIKDLAKHLGVSRVALSELVNEKRGVSLEMAQRLGKAFGNGTRFWLALQMQHDIWHAERRSKISVRPLKWKISDAA